MGVSRASPNATVDVGSPACGVSVESKLPRIPALQFWRSGRLPRAGPRVGIRFPIAMLLSLSCLPGSSVNGTGPHEPASTPPGGGIGKNFRHRDTIFDVNPEKGRGDVQILHTNLQ